MIELTGVSKIYRSGDRECRALDNCPEEKNNGWRLLCSGYAYDDFALSGIACFCEAKADIEASWNYGTGEVEIGFMGGHFRTSGASAGVHIGGIRSKNSCSE